MKPYETFPAAEFVGLGLDFPYMEGQNPEETDYLEQYFPYTGYGTGSPIQLANTEIGSSSVQYAIYDDEPWNGYRPSPPSEESRSSTSTSANGPSPSSTIGAFSTEYEIPYPSPRTTYDFIPDLRTRTPAVHEAPQSATNTQCLCTECCPSKSFGRSYDLIRHINEQHRCPRESCRDFRFRTPKEKREHEKSHKSPVGYRCGTCENSGHEPRGLKRAEKLKNHFRDVHGITGDINVRDYVCKREPCYMGFSCGGLYFTSSVDLDQHNEREHQSRYMCSMASNDVSNASINPLPSLDVSTTGKHFLDGGDEPGKKRSRVNETRIASLTSPQTDLRSNIMSPALQSSKLTSRSISETLSLHQTSLITQRIESKNSISGSPVHVVETVTLSIVELHSLTKQHELKDVIADLESLQISSNYDCRNAAMKLRGTCSESQMQRAKTMLLNLINRSKLAIAPRNDMETPPQPRRHHGFQQVSFFPQPEISALHPDVDADLLNIWHQHFLPQFPRIVREASIKGKYSAILVHQAGDDGVHPIIRFRSEENQGNTSRQLIRQRIKEICSLHDCTFLEVQFTEGSLVRLVAGATSTTPIDDPSNDQRFPHQRRPWRTPGMGASIGLGHCPDISATLGGYIWVDGRVFMVSVDHFISKCRCHGMTNANSVRSPSISDIAEVRRQLRRKLEDLELKICLSAPDEVPLGDARAILFLNDVNEELELYEGFKRELDNEDRGFALGKIRHRCGAKEHPLKPPANPRWDEEMRRMDWSLTEVTEPDRQGKNIHRHQRIVEPQVEDLSNEVTQPFGSGVPCEHVSEVRGGEQVHYVGSTSGLRKGVVSASLALIGEEDNVSYEWFMMVENCQRLPDTAFKGDSGAWIIKDDNQLLGLLWGWEGGVLLFTPIHDVFADIRRTVHCQDIKLPDFSTSGSQRPRSTQLCCRVVNSPRSEVEILQEAEVSPIDIPSLGLCLLSPADIEDKVRRRRGSSVSSTNGGHLSAVPSLVSMPSMISSASSTSLYEDLCPKAERLLLDEAPQRKALPRSEGLTIANDADPEQEWQVVKQEEILEDESPWEFEVQLRLPSRKV